MKGFLVGSLLLVVAHALYGVYRYEVWDISAFDELVTRTMKISPEMTEVTHRTAVELLKRSPKWDLTYYACPRGEPGMPGMMGPPGEQDMADFLTPDDIRTAIFKGLATPSEQLPFNCNVDRAVKEATGLLLAANLRGSIDRSYPLGPAGISGPLGAPMSEAIRVNLEPHCSRSTASALSTWYLPECDFVLDVVHAVSDVVRAKTDAVVCPHNLQGIAGRVGSRGLSFDKLHPVLQDPDTWELIARWVCPDTYRGKYENVTITPTLVDGTLGP